MGGQKVLVLRLYVYLLHPYLFVYRPYSPLGTFSLWVRIRKGTCNLGTFRSSKGTSNVVVGFGSKRYLCVSVYLYLFRTYLLNKSTYSNLKYLLQKVLQFLWKVHVFTKRYIKVSRKVRVIGQKVHNSKSTQNQKGCENGYLLPILQVSFTKCTCNKYLYKYLLQKVLVTVYQKVHVSSKGTRTLSIFIPYTMLVNGARLDVG